MNKHVLLKNEWKFLFLGMIILLQSLYLFSQGDLYIPLEFQNAYKNNTRSYDGKPGSNYWQNFSTYDIKVEVIPGKWEIKGEETIVYENKSPDTLRYLNIKTYPNHYKKGVARANMVPDEDLTDGMIIQELRINNDTFKMEDNPAIRNFSTFFRIKLKVPLPPNSSSTLNMRWSASLPPTYVNRMGAYDEQSAFMGYWYPQIAVYDDIDGLDYHEYMGSQEFYTDLASFTVKITLPAGYKVWATGDLQNPEQVLSKNEYKKYRKAKKSEEKVVIDPGGNTANNDKSNASWIFTADSVRDFAAGISNNFKWEASSVKLNTKSVFSNFVCDTTLKDTMYGNLQIQNKSLKFLSDYYPGIEYPFNNFTTFVGVKRYDGMEFPMMANNGLINSEIRNADVIFHEMSHTYFPFYMGINEVKYSWMDEGWAFFLTLKFFQDFYRGTKNENEELDRLIQYYSLFAGHQFESPLIAPSNHLPEGMPHTQLSYLKPAILYLTLEDMLGKEHFSTCLKTYINRWAGKHPTPYDFMFTFNDVSGQDLSWFWRAWIFEYGYPDLALKEVKDSNIYIQNYGRLPVPINLRLSYKNGEEIIIHKTAAIWEKSEPIVSIPIEHTENLQKAELLSNTFPDIVKSNNVLDLNLK